MPYIKYIPSDSQKTLDSKIIYHAHSGTSGSTSPNGCYRRAYTSSENYARGTGYIGRTHSDCPWCGSTTGYNEDAWGRTCGYCGSWWTQYTSYCSNCGRSGGSDDGNHNHNITRYALSCSHDGEDIGEIYLNAKRRKLSALKSENAIFDITAYYWSGVANGSTEEVKAESAGSVSVDVTILDPYSGNTRTDNLTGIVEH